MVGLEFVTMAGTTDALNVFSAVGTPSSDFPDEPRRHNVVHMTVDTSLLELNSTRLHLALPTKCSRTTFSPSLPGWSRSRPLPIHAAPAHWPLLGTEAGPAV